MPFFARPNLSDIQFKQITGSTLTLSGETRISTPSGLTLIGQSGYVPINLTTGNTNYNVLTYIDGEIILQPASGGGSGVYTGASPTTCTVGGLCSGTAIIGCSISSILEEILVPPIPLSTSLSIATGGSDRQYGDYSVGNLCWNVVKNTNLITCIAISRCGDGTYQNLYSGAGIGSTGSTIGYTFTTPTASSGATSCTVTFSLSAKTTASETSLSNATITWQNKKFYLGNSICYSSISNSGLCVVLSAATGTLSTTKTLNISQTLNNEFFYYVYPKTFGVPNFTVNGLPNNAWGNINTGTLFTITFINTNGYSNQYYVARSDNRITGTYNIIAS